MDLSFALIAESAGLGHLEYTIREHQGAGTLFPVLRTLSGNGWMYLARPGPGAASSVQHPTIVEVLGRGGYHAHR